MCHSGVLFILSDRYVKIARLHFLPSSCRSQHRRTCSTAHADLMLLPFIPLLLLGIPTVTRPRTHNGCSPPKRSANAAMPHTYHVPRTTSFCFARLSYAGRRPQEKLKAIIRTYPRSSVRRYISLTSHSTHSSHFRSLLEDTPSGRTRRLRSRGCRHSGRTSCSLSRLAPQTRHQWWRERSAGWR